MYVWIADNAAAPDFGASCFKLGLDKSDNVAARFQEGSRHPQNQGERDERDINHYQINELGQLFYIARV